MDIFKAANQFNSEIIGYPRPEEPAMLDASRLAWAYEVLKEELGELVDAQDLAGQADALIDLMYFGAGRLYEMGVDGRAVLKEVHRANMDKVRGDKIGRDQTHGYDARKPDGWVPPDVVSNLGGPASPNVLIIGHGRHGKDTVAEILRDLYGLAFTSSSLFCAERILLPHFNSVSFLPSYETAEQCYADRHGRTKVLGMSGHIEHRTVWYDQIAAYCLEDPARLARAIFAENNIYCGMRSPTEFVGGLRADLFDVVVWVDRSKHVDAEPASSMGLTKEMADCVIDNNGDLDDLVEEVHAFAEEWL